MGGNAKCRAFFEASPDYNKNMAIADKVLQSLPLLTINIALTYRLIALTVHVPFRLTI